MLFVDYGTRDAGHRVRKTIFHVFLNGIDKKYYL